MGSQLCTDAVPAEFSALSTPASSMQLVRHSYEGNVKAWEVTHGAATPYAIPPGKPPQCLSPSSCFIVLGTSTSTVFPKLTPPNASDFVPNGTAAPFFDSTFLRHAQALLTDEPNGKKYFTIYLWEGLQAPPRDRLTALAKALEVERRLIADDALAERLLYWSQVCGLTPSSALPPTQPVAPRGMGINLSALTNVRAEPDERAERLKHSSHVASEIVKNKLYVGGELPAGNLELLQSLGIETVINMSPASVPSSFPNEFQYIAYDVYDTASEDIASLIPSVLRVIHEGGKVYLHCQQGVSRSISMAVAYVMWKDGLSCDAALAYVKARRSIASPNSGFLTRLYEYQAHLSNPAPLRVARFGAYRGDTTFPLVFHDITPPTSNTPSGPKLILDPRTTYAVVLGRDCYLWEGKGCPKAVTAAANATFADLLRYGYYTIGATNTSDTQKGTTVTYTADPTRATSSVQVITDGDEPKAFMTSLKSVIGRPDIRLVSDPIDAFAAYYTDEFIQFVNGGKSKPPPASPRKVEVPAIPLLAPALPTNPSSNTPTTLPDSMSVLHYPDFEEIEIFEFGDFLSTEAYLIIRVSHGHRDLHAWAGRDSEVGNNPDLIIDGYILKEGEDVLQDSSVNVMVEGEETDDFLGLF